MIQPLDEEPEKFPPTGGVEARGIKKSLGTPRHDRLEVVVRETVQNSWDARRDDAQQVLHQVSLRHLDPAELEFLSKIVFKNAFDPQLRASRKTALTSKELRVLQIADFGTSGLGGPTRADVVSSSDESTDFVDFMRKVGAPRDKEHGAGTYGFGKSSLYLASHWSTVIVHTRCRANGRATERLMACRLGDALTIERGSARGAYTGRTFWGRSAGDTVEPLAGKEAKAAARALGMPERKSDDFGTSILIVDPDLAGSGEEDRSPAQAVNAIHETLLWTYWPKMVAQDDGRPPMMFEVRLDDADMPVPDPKSHPPLQIYMQAMEKLKSGAADVREIRCKRPKQLLGRLALMKYPVEEREHLDTGIDTSATLERSHHVALMRPAELVVKYLRGPQLVSDKVEYGGVFVCDEGVEDAFAAAEPPAHDDWIYQNLERPGKTYVRQAIIQIGNCMKEFAERYNPRPETGTQSSMGVAADRLGRLLHGTAGPRLGGIQKTRKKATRRGGGRKGGIRAARPEFLGFTSAREGAEPAAMFQVELTGKGRFRGQITGLPAVNLDGNSTTAEPSGAATPEVIRWTDDRGNRLAKGAQADLDVACPSRLIAYVTVPTDCAITLQVDLSARA